MRTSLSASRWICLLSLAVVMIVSASQVDSFFASPVPNCCQRGRNRKVDNIKACYKQENRPRCPYDALWIESSSSSRPICVHPEARWVKKLSCPSEFSPRRRFKVLDDEDDDEW